MKERLIMILLLGVLTATVGIAVETGAIGPTQDPKAASASCTRTAAGLLPAPALAGTAAPAAAPASAPAESQKATVGKPAPNFEAMALVRGEFKPVKLSDYKGKWVLLCFYPGDFTFV